MRFGYVIDRYVADMRAQGRIGSKRTEVAYRQVLVAHAEDIHNRDPRYVGRENIKRTLARWSNPNTQRTRRAILVSFYDWLMEEGYRKDNPARQTRRPRQRPPRVYRLTREEAARMLAASEGRRERRAIFVGICAGLRSAELRGLRGHHLRREGFLWVSADIAKGGRERFVPVIAELEPILAEARGLADEDYLLPAQRFRDPGQNKTRRDYLTSPCSPQALYHLVKRVGERAGIPAPVHPHLMRHAYGDHIARFAGVRNAQALLGHASLGTTDAYLGQPTLDELALAVRGFSFGITRASASSVQVPIFRGEGEVVAHALVDARDADWARKYRWRLERGYAKFCKRVDGRLQHFYLHRMVLGLNPGDPQRVDHRNRDPLDCRRANLRLATVAENAQNRAVAGNRKTSSRYRGVSRAGGRWRAQVCLDGKNHHLGQFDFEEEAARVAADFRREHHPFADADYEPVFYPGAESAPKPPEAPTGIEPVYAALQAAA